MTQPKMSLNGKTILERCDRILELPPLLEAEGRKLVGLRSDRRVLERKLKAREAALRKELMELSEYQACKNSDERAALFEDSKYTDPNWEGMTERHEQLTALIEHAVNHKDALDHERKALKAALEREYAEIIEQVLQDRALAKAVMGRLAA